MEQNNKFRRESPTLDICLNDKERKPGYYYSDRFRGMGGYDWKTNTIRLYMQSILNETKLMQKAGYIGGDECDFISGIIDNIRGSDLHELEHWGVESYHKNKPGLTNDDFTAVGVSCGINYDRIVLEHRVCTKLPKHWPVVIVEQ